MKRIIDLKKVREMKKELELKRFLNSSLISSTISSFRHICIDERIDDNGLPFIFMYNFYLQEYLFFDTPKAALLHLCDTTCYTKTQADQYLDDVEFLVDKFDNTEEGENDE
ncbi:MAG TPA: hypothetical protein GX707_14970 [Epulopiscium sp.]|nr:hypothetical protein [Candidatus Epulonipiscium sp.]